MRYLSYDIVHQGPSYFIKLGSNTNVYVQQFLSCIDDEELIQLKKHIKLNGKYIANDQKDILLFILQLSKKIVNKLNIEIKYYHKDLPYEKEIFLLLSARIDNGKVIFNYREKLIELLDLDQETLNESNSYHEVINNVEEKQVQNEEVKQLNEIKKEMQDKASEFNLLLQKIDSNQHRIDSIHEEIKKLSQQLPLANATLKLEIYKKHSELTHELENLIDENERIEFESQGEKKQTDANALKVIAKHYQSRISEIYSELKSSQLSLNQHKRSTKAKLFFTSQYHPNNKPFSISNIIKNKSLTKYESIYAVIFNLLNRGSSINPSNRLSSDQENQLMTVYQFQMMILSHLRYGYLDDHKWVYNLTEEHHMLFKKAYEEIIYWTKHICSLADIEYTIPKLVINDINGYRVCLNQDKDPLAFVIENSIQSNQKTELWISNLINYHIQTLNKKHVQILNEILTWLFRFQSFREGQIPIIANFLNGKNTLGILPTGAGKSLTYYFCVLMQPKISLVIAPINSLIIDQIDKLKNIHGINRITNITSSSKDMTKEILSLKNSEAIFNFISPERAQIQQFRDILITLNYTNTIGSVILDEVHCLSEWGHDFRVPYLMLAETLNTYANGTKYLGLTATASVNVVRDLIIELSISEKDVITTEHMRRENLEFEIKSFNDAFDAQQEFIKIIKQNLYQNNMLDMSESENIKNAILVFSQTKKSLETSVEVIYELISSQLESIEKGLSKLVGLYTGDYKNDQFDFMNDKKTIMIATKAFGMGIDKSNIRMTLHFGMPASRENFYQEAGRAGRDGNLSLCKLYAIRPQDSAINSLVKEFLNPKTNVFRMNEIMKYLRRLKVDIATTFYFFLDGYEEPEIESENTLDIYEKISHHNSYHVKLKNLFKKSTEKYLYILFKLGIVKTWNVKYLFEDNELSTRVDFDIELNQRFQNFEHVKNNALTYINAYAKQDETHVIEAETKYINRIQELNSFDQLQELIKIMREWYHSLFIMTKREQISNMYDMINDFSNKGPTIEIQQVIDRFFNITDVIGKAKEGYDLLTFEGNSISDVVRFAFELEKDYLNDRKYEMQTVLQSNVNIKNSLYTSIIYLRLDEFIDSHNGDQRFEYAISQLNSEELNELIDACINHYEQITEDQKTILIKQLRTHDDMLIHKIYEIYQEDLVIQEYALAYIYSNFNESWE